MTDDSKIKLLSHQYEHYNNVCQIVQNQYAYLDLSNMGSGKTFITLALAAKYNLSLIVICPLSMITIWEKACQNYRINLKAVTTYQSLRGSGKKPLKHCLLEKIDNQYQSTNFFKNCVKEGLLLVFDECHKLKNPTAQLQAAHTLVKTLININSGSRIALLSATPFDKREHSVSILKMLGIILHDKLYNYQGTTNSYELLGLAELIKKCKQINYLATKMIIGNYLIDKKRAYELCYELFQKIIRPQVTSIMSSPKLDSEKDIADGFYNIRNKDLQLLTYGINMLQKSTNYNDTIKSVNLTSIRWSDITTSLLIIEVAKLSTMIRLATTTLNNNPQSKVILYFNFIKTIKSATKRLKTFNPLVMYGQTKSQDRKNIISKFQLPTNDYRVLISNPIVGGVGINLDDHDGNWPRFMYVVPTYNFIDLHQATGRIYRTTTKSKACIRFVYSKDYTIEASILNSLAKKAEVARKILDHQTNILFPGEYPTFIEN